MKLSELANGTAAFFKLLKNGKISELDRLLDSGKVLGEFTVTKFENDEAFKLGEAYSRSNPFRNQLVNVGMVAIWDLVTNQASATAFSNANAYLGVGDSTTAVNVAQTDLQAATNKLRVSMDATFPLAPSNGIEQWQSTFTSGQANYSWQEFAVFNASSSGVMMNRSLSNQGTKTAGQTWQLLYQITLS